VHSEAEADGMTLAGEPGKYECHLSKNAEEKAHGTAVGAVCSKRLMRIYVVV